MNLVIEIGRVQRAVLIGVRGTLRTILTTSLNDILRISDSRKANTLKVTERLHCEILCYFYGIYENLE